MDTIVVYSAHNSNRLAYTLDWLLKERLQLNYTITSDKNAAAHIAYGHALPGALSIPDGALLSQTGIEQRQPHTGTWGDLPVLFASAGGGYTLPFDILSAIFFLLSRYEEYNNLHHDKHGRYQATSSILHKHGLLARPIVDEWVHAFRRQLHESLGLEAPTGSFAFQPTYDIDMAYSHIYKGVGRIMGAYVRALLRGDVRQINERTQVLKKKQKDPYDSFRWLRQLHKLYDYKPIYFILAAAKTTTFDKNIHPNHPAMMRVIKNLAKEGAIGIHPSYYSDQGDVMAREKGLLEHVAGRTTTLSRQHYIKLCIPSTYRQLQDNGITTDYSMGYGTHLGFRAGTGSSFLWYDLEREQATELRVYPFCFMDTTAHYDNKLSATDAFAQLAAMSRILERTNSTLITIFHNFSLGTAAEWRGWKHAYEQFLEEQAARHRDLKHNY